MQKMVQLNVLAKSGLKQPIGFVAIRVCARLQPLAISYSSFTPRNDSDHPRVFVTLLPPAILVAVKQPGVKGIALHAVPLPRRI